jgi:Resolvase, N terminal domain
MARRWQSSRARSLARVMRARPRFAPIRPMNIAKLDRLSRNVAFIATLMDSGVEFIAVDNPHATKLTVHILAAVAQHEREIISARTAAALRAAKARGKRLGNRKLRPRQLVTGQLPTWLFQPLAHPVHRPPVALAVCSRSLPGYWCGPRLRRMPPS